MAKKNTNRKPLWRFLFLVYCAAMLWLLFDRPVGWTEGLSYGEQLRQNANLQPFYTIKNYWYVLKSNTNPYLVRHCFINLAGNILLFIPMGWLLPQLWKKQRNFLCFFVTCSAAIFLVEALQLLTLLGSFDVDDWILNISGMVLGFLFYLIFPKKR